MYNPEGMTELKGLSLARYIQLSRGCIYRVPLLLLSETTIRILGSVRDDWAHMPAGGASIIVMTPLMSIYHLQVWVGNWTMTDDDDDRRCMWEVH